MRFEYKLLYKYEAEGHRKQNEPKDILAALISTLGATAKPKAAAEKIAHMKSEQTAFDHKSICFELCLIMINLLKLLFLVFLPVAFVDQQILILKNSELVNDHQRRM
jgi:long-subunit acyl-CoA synthetase (AMP-forming)